PHRDRRPARRDTPSLWVAEARSLSARSDRAIALSLAAIGALTYLAAGFGLLTDYDYYGRLAQALDGGRWWLDEAPPWLNELLPCGDGRYCVAYPPLPALLTAPLAFFLPTALAQVLVSRIAGGASGGVLFLGLRAFGAPRLVAIGGAALSALGSTRGTRCSPSVTCSSRGDSSASSICRATSRRSSSSRPTSSKARRGSCVRGGSACRSS